MKLSHILLIIILSMSCVPRANAQQSLSPKKSIDGIYGYKDSSGEWKFPPQFKKATPYQGKFAAVTFDGNKYALINKYGGIVTEFVFDGSPEAIFDNLVLVSTPEHKKYLAKLTGERLCPDQSRLHMKNGIIYGDDSSSGKKCFMDACLKQVGPGTYNNLYIVDNIISINDSIYHCNFAEAAMVGNITDMLDLSGGRIMPSNLHDVKCLGCTSGVKLYWDKAFKGIDLKWDIMNLFFAAKDIKTDKYGIYFIDGRQILPPKHKTAKKAAEDFNKSFKKKVYPQWADGTLTRAAIAKLNALENTRREQAKRNLASAGLSDKPLISEFDQLYSYVSVSQGKDSGNKSKKGKSKSRNKKASASRASKSLLNPYGSSTRFSSEKFDDIIDNKIVFFCRGRGSKKYHLYNAYGMRMTTEPYDEIKSWGFNRDESQRFLVRNGKEWGIINIVGDEVLSPQFSEIGSASGKDVKVRAKRDGTYYLVNFQTGKMFNDVAYDEIDMYERSDGSIKVKRLGYETFVDKNGKENPSIASIAFNDAQKLTGTNEQKVVAYAKAVELCGPADRTILGASYCNIGYYYSQAGDIANAKRFYQLGAQNGSQVAADNLKSLNNQTSQNSTNSSGAFWNDLAQGLGQLFGGDSAVAGFAAGLTGQGSSSQYDSDFSSDSDGYSASSTASSGNSNRSGYADESYYRNTYSRWEREAKSNYEALTRQGSRTKTNGSYTSGTSDGYWRHHYSGLKKLLRNAQSNMRKTRHEAKRAGYNITQSNYETITVTN